MPPSTAVDGGRGIGIGITPSRAVGASSAVPSPAFLHFGAIRRQMSRFSFDYFALRCRSQLVKRSPLHLRAEQVLVQIGLAALPGLSRFGAGQRSGRLRQGAPRRQYGRHGRDGKRVQHVHDASFVPIVLTSMTRSSPTVLPSWIVMFAEAPPARC